MAQENYFTYNIIDTIYFNQPVGEELTKLYGVDGQFKRRDPSQYASLSDDEKREYNENEKRFIQGVINKYIIDDYNNSYIGIDPNYHDQLINTNRNMDVTYAYFNSNREKGIELTDMITNINGVHNYKLMSAKDIDFDNVILPNSAITREFNWGGFDRNRRWGNKPIHINNTFELLNVVDYLLCACDNLWNELYKIKYSVNEGVELWFSKNVSDNVLIHSSRQLVAQDFQINSDRPDTSKMITYLNPMKYYTSLNNDENNNFGIVTNFYKLTSDIDNLQFDRKIVDISGKNIIVMTILPASKDIGNHVLSLSQNVNGNLQQIYSYKIGNELKLYPGSRIDSFINDRYIKTLSNEIVDFKNKRLKNETFFKSNPGDNIFSKVYIKFLNQSKLNLSNNSDDFKNPYLLYYLTDEGKKIIIGYSYEGSGETLVKNIYNNIRSTINSLPSYEFYSFENNALDDQAFWETINSELKIFPKFYIINDEFFSTFEVATPNSKKFSASSKSINIYYYKNNNKLNCTVTRLDKNDEDQIEILPENDPIQSQALTYNYFRYNIPDNQDITFKFDATYIALDSTPEGNPLGLKLDDEYKDIMLYHTEDINTEEKAAKYYELQNVETSGLYKRIFEQFNLSSFQTHKGDYTSTDAKSNEYKHTWMKYDNPYRLHAIIDQDELVNQTITSEEVKNEISYIVNWNELKMTSYNTYTFNHVLGEDIEEVKIDLRFQIDETSKVKATECVIPLNINKIYYPTINYFSYQAIKLENANYSNIKYTYRDNQVDKYITLSDIYEKSFFKYQLGNSNNSDKQGLDYVPNIYKIMTGGNNDINSLDELQLETTYNNVINNTCFEFTYKSSNNIIDLLGGWYTEQYFIQKLKKGFAPAQLRYENDSQIEILKNIGENVTDTNHLYFFNLNGFNKRYRLHGNNKTVPDRILTLTDDAAKLTIYNEFDLISLASEKDHQSINKQLKIKLVDDAQLTYISVNGDNNESIWEENNNDFNSGINIVDKDYIIKTLPIDIYKTSYQISCIQDYNNLDTSEKFTYYVPITYGFINSSTFYPPASTIPNGIVPDINDPIEKEKYQNYMECWSDETNNYHPITLSLKLFDNTTYSNPYYYESNEAVMKFNILRAEPPTQIVNITGINEKLVFVAKNSYYYLSDFIHIEPTDGLTVVDNMYPTGSYFYYNEQYQSYIVNEIYSNTINTHLGNSHNAHYENALVNTTSLDLDQYLHSFDANNPFEGAIIPYPIFRKKITDENTTISFSDVYYDYDIYRLSDINKLNITNIECNKYYLTNSNNNENELNNDIIDMSSNIQGLYTNKTFHTIHFDTNFYENFCNDNSFNILRYYINFNDIIGSKNYKGATSSTNGVNTFICPIIRQKISDDSNSPREMPSIYTTREFNNKIYEFFEFRYENVYKVKKIDNNDNWECTSLAPSDNLPCNEAYQLQLELFLLNSSDDFISDKSTWETFYENNND